MKNFKLIKSSLILSAVLLLAASCNFWSKPQIQTPAPALEQTSNNLPTQRSFFYDGQEGVDALTLLKSLHQVETKDFGAGLGEFVQSINGIKPNADQFWAFYVNGKSATVGASSYVTKKGDKIEWRMEKISSE